MAVMDTSCLYSTVKNISGGTMVFGFLPPHGRELANNEEFTVFGDIRGMLGGNAGAEPAVHRRSQIAFEAAIEAGYLEVLSTPASIYFDVTGDAPKIIKVDDGAVEVADPCWHDSVA